MLRYCLARMRDLHPEWEYLFFSDGDARDFVLQNYPELSELYDWYPRSVLRADLFRLLAVHKLGGFYLDTDVLLDFPLGVFSQFSCVFAVEHRIDQREFDLRYPKWSCAGEEKLTLANYAFGARPGHPFIAQIIEELISRTKAFERENCNDLDVLHASGPDAVTTVYYRDKGRWDDVVILRPREGCSGFGEFGLHLVNGSWRTT